MIKSMFALTALTLAAAAPAAAQMSSAAPAGNLPMCSKTVHDSCQQGNDDARAMTAAQAMASGGVGDRGHDDAAQMGSGDGAMHGGMHKGGMHHRTMHHRMTQHHMMSKTGGTTTTTDTTTSSTPQ